MEKQMTLILVCDDDEEQCGKTVRALDGIGTVTTLAGEDLTQALTALFEKISTVLNSRSNANDTEIQSEFDGYDIAIVDNNLTGLSLKGARFTAETIVGYLRAFSNTPYFVSLNKNLHVDFDLQCLFGDHQSISDIALNTDHLSNSWLWDHRTDGNGFAPWYWPLLPFAADRRRLQVQFVQEAFNNSVWDSLGFPSEAESYLSSNTRDVLESSSNRSLRETTFEEFFEKSRVPTPAEKDALKAKKDLPQIERAIHQITAHEVDCWLRRDVLGSQDVLIDVPHLIAQMPLLLAEKSKELTFWNESILTSIDNIHTIDETLYGKFLANAKFKHPIWTCSPCFWWPLLNENEELTQLFLNTKVDWPDAVFCEDMSQFREINPTRVVSSPKEFETSIGGSWGRRHIAHLEGISYSPSSRIVEIMI